MLSNVPYSKLPRTIAYGTAGFRTKAADLPYVVFTVGVLAAVRSMALGQTVGVMVTALHNPPCDNGVKVVDPLGDMLEQSWEAYATRLANTPESELETAVGAVMREVGANPLAIPQVVVGRDTRESGPELVAAAVAGIQALGGRVTDAGVCTTPQLHYLTRCANDRAFGEASLEGYYAKTAKAVGEIRSLYGLTDPIRVTLDAANGVGGPAMAALAKVLGSAAEIELVNNNSADPAALNVDCGADYVKTGQRLPAGVATLDGALHASFDGDADRVVCYYADPDFHLLDGDKIATLLAEFLTGLVAAAGLDLTVGIVQTAYANGAATKHAETLGKVVCTPTGVKHLHHAAKQFDIGVYFEANGHGTVLYGPRALAVEGTSKEAQALVLFGHVINQTVGDAIGDLLAVVLVLQILGRKPAEWNQAYTDLPNKLDKVVVADRAVYTTTDAERRLVTPAGVQEQVDAIVGAYAGGRSFVRASGTEDAVRVYAEAADAESVREIVDKVKVLLK